MRTGSLAITGGQEDLELTALTAVYLADRADHAAGLTNAVAVLGAGIAYATATLAFFEQILSSLKPALIALLPFPLWMVLLYHALIAAAAMTRSASIRALEREIMTRTRFSEQIAARTGFRVANMTFNVTQSSLPHKLSSIISYSGTGLVAVGYTIYVLSQNSGVAWPWGLVSIIGYSLLGVLWLAAWASGVIEYARSEAVLADVARPDADAETVAQAGRS
jgi:hypothetical protein